MVIEARNTIYFLSQHDYLGDRTGLPQTIDELLHNGTMGGLIHLGAVTLISQARRAGLNVNFINFKDLISNPQKQTEFVNKINSDPHSAAMISSMDINSSPVDQLARQLPPERTIVGGVGPTFAPDLYQGNYAIATGHVEGSVFAQILDHFSARKRFDPSYNTNHPPFSDNINDYPEFDSRYSPLFGKMGRGSILLPVEICRGCHYSCDFCHTGQHLIHANVKPLSVVEEQFKIYSQIKMRWPFIIFYDQNLVLPYMMPKYGRDYLLDLMSLVKKYGLYWAGEGTLGDIVKKGDTEVLEKLGERCLSILVGAENLLGEVGGAKEKTHLNHDFLHHVEVLRKCKVPVMWSLIGGLDNQKPDYFSKVVEKVNELKLPVIFHRAVARPGTEFYDSVKQEGRIISNNSTDRDMKFSAAHAPSDMTVEDALGGHTYVHQQLFTIPSITRRFIHHWKESGFQYAVKCLPPDIHGILASLRLQFIYDKELKIFKDKYVKPAKECDLTQTIPSTNN